MPEILRCQKRYLACEVFSALRADYDVGQDGARSRVRLHRFVGGCGEGTVYRILRMLRFIDGSGIGLRVDLVSEPFDGQLYRLFRRSADDFCSAEGMPGDDAWLDSVLFLISPVVGSPDQ